jgi:HSP20 family protein
MADRGTASWGRGRTGPESRFAEEGNPLLALYREVNRTFDEFLRGIDLPMFGRGGAGAWPHVDVSETETEVRVVAELPGMDEKDVEVTLHDGVLTLAGEKKAESEGAVRRERWFGAFRRAIQIGPDIDPERVGASFKNGVLTVTLGKREKPPSPVKRIPISGSGGA